MDFIEEKIKDKHFQLEEYSNKMAHLRVEFTKLISSMKSKESVINDRDSELSQLRADYEQSKSQLEERESEISKLR